MSARPSQPPDGTPTLERRVEILEIGHAHMTRQMADVAIALQDVTRCLESGTTKMGTIERELADNSTTTREVRDILSAVKAGLRVIGGVGVLFRWIGYLATAAIAVYGAWQLLRTGVKPPGA